MSNSQNTLDIKIISDLVCPWCLVGYEQLKLALEQLPEIEAKITWQAFEINPHMPAGGQNLREHIQEKYGSSAEESQGMRDRLQAIGEKFGFQFNYSDESRTYNTFRAHQLLHWAKEQGKQTELKLALFEAHFTRNEAIDQIDVLSKVAASVGLDQEQARLVLEDERFAQAVRSQEQGWQMQGVRAVPSMVINDKYLTSGARQPEELVFMFRDLVSEAVAKS